MIRFFFEVKERPSELQKLKLAQEANLDEMQVTTYFQNARSIRKDGKQRREQMRERYQELKRLDSLAAQPDQQPDSSELDRLGAQPNQDDSSDDDSQTADEAPSFEDTQNLVEKSFTAFPGRGFPVIQWMGAVGALLCQCKKRTRATNQRSTKQPDRE